jgi:hypothetical protein
MTTDREDLSSWVLHFVHRRAPENNPAYNINEGEESPAFPYHEDGKVNARFDFWETVDESQALAPDDYSLEVLLKIIRDGHIRSGWSFRNDKPTIYGPRAACCFTEMPLYSWQKYAASRGPNSVDSYAIAIPKSEFFVAGGRPVIYGLSGPHKELHSSPLPFPPNYRWPRKLSPDCGIAESEQYRYVAMNLGSARPIDWSHEREWRCADVRDKCSCPGLPIWLKNEPIQFSQAIVIVRESKEVQYVLDQIKELFDAGHHNYDYAYNREALSNTRVVALEDLAKAGKKRLLRLDDLPASKLDSFKRPLASAQLCSKVKAALKAANAAAKIAATEADDSLPDVCGFADVTVHDPQSRFVSALIKLDKIHVIGGIGYVIRDIPMGSSQSLRVKEAAAEAAMRALKQHFPQIGFSVRSRWD